jgi:hypothetical protein
MIPKQESGPYWPRLLKESGKRQWLKTDFARWKDEDEEEVDAPAAGGMDPSAAFGGLDFSQLASGFVSHSLSVTCFVLAHISYIRCFILTPISPI